MSSSMSARRVPLASNPNAANSPLRGAAAAAGVSSTSAAFAKQRRSHASLQREDSYGQPPPAKKLMVERVDSLGGNAVSGNGTTRRAQQQAHRSTERVQQQQQHVQHAQQTQHHQHTAAQKVSEKEAEEVRRWQQSQRQRFPKLVFYFDSLPEDQSARLAKQVMYLGAREDKFFSIDITHVVTTRAIPPEEKTLSKQQQQQQLALQKDAPEADHEHVQTINPSLLSRNHSNDLGLGLSTTSLPVKRKLFDTAPNRRMPLAPFGAAEDAIRKPKPARSMDVLHRAREMGKKIWSLEKLQRVLDMLLEPDPYRSAELGQRIRNGAGAVGMAGANQSGASRLSGNHALLRMLDKERQTGPSDRDPTVATRELIYFKGPYIYVYDIEEKQRPIMVREYLKVADKEEGDWPQLRPSAGTRCPFIEDTDQIELRAEKKKARMRSAAAAKAAGTAAAAAAGASAGTREASAAVAGAGGSFAQKVLASRLGATGTANASKQVTGKRTLAEMEDGHNRRAVSTAGLRSMDKKSFDSTTAAVAASAGSVSSVTSAVPPTRAAHGASASADFQAQNAFTSRAKSARCFAGEPVASGLQAAGITSAIRSQMISSATGTLGARAGTSKEIHGLQRKVLQKSTTATSQQDLSSRRMADSGMEQAQQAQGHSYSRSTSVVRSTAAAAATAVQPTAKGNVAVDAGDEKHKRTMSAPVAARPQRARKRDPKPGYCENCQDKFDDFDDHIVSHKHRKFAEDARNWTELDALLGQLTRRAKYADDWSD